MSTVPDDAQFADLPRQRGQDEVAAFERMPPQDLDSEQSVLGAMLLSQDAIEDITGGVKLTGRDFYRPAHTLIFDAICHLYAKGEPADPITVTAELTRRGELTKIGGAPYLHSLVQTVPTAGNGEYYAEIVQGHATNRRLTEAGMRITQLGYSGMDPTDAVDKAGQELSRVADENTHDDYSLIGTTLGEDLDAVEAEVDPGLPTSFMDLDGLLSGFKPGEFIIIAGRPAMGKSTLALDVARVNAVTHGTPVAFFSLEMGKREINYKILSAEARVPLHHIRGREKGKTLMTDEDWTRLARITPRVSAAPLWVDDSANLSIMEIRAKARRLVQRHGVKLVVVDYIQLMKTGAKAENRQQEVSDISRNLKLLAKELKVPVIGLSQLNRGPEQRADRVPMVSDLRESGSLEQDADVVILLHREDAYEKESPRAGEADLIVAKHRNGPTGIVTVGFQGHYSRFVDMAKM